MNVDTWIETNISNLAVTSPLMLHVDELEGQELPRRRWLATVIAGFVDFRKRALEMGEPIIALAYIPLIGSDEIVPPPRSTFSLLNEMHADEPPSVGLMDMRAFVMADHSEFYQCPVASDVVPISLPKIFRTYTCARSWPVDESELEYQRMISLHSAPLTL